MNEKVKAWMDQIIGLADALASLANAQQVLLTEATHITSVVKRDKVQGGTGKGLEDVMAELTDTDIKYSETIRQLSVERNKRFDVIRVAVSDGRGIAVLVNKYINRKTWEQMSMDTHKAINTLKKYHKRAMQEVEDYLELHPEILEGEYEDD